jgi:hypothetical protein
MGLLTESNLDSVSEAVSDLGDNGLVDPSSLLFGDMVVAALFDEALRLVVHRRETPFLPPGVELGVLLPIGPQGDVGRTHPVHPEVLEEVLIVVLPTLRRQDRVNAETHLEALSLGPSGHVNT